MFNHNTWVFVCNVQVRLLVLDSAIVSHTREVATLVRASLETIVAHRATAHGPQPPLGPPEKASPRQQRRARQQATPQQSYTESKPQHPHLPAIDSPSVNPQSSLTSTRSSLEPAVGFSTRIGPGNAHSSVSHSTLTKKMTADEARRLVFDQPPGKPAGVAQGSGHKRLGHDTTSGFGGGFGGGGSEGGGQRFMQAPTTSQPHKTRGSALPMPISCLSEAGGGGRRAPVATGSKAASATRGAERLPISAVVMTSQKRSAAPPATRFGCV